MKSTLKTLLRLTATLLVMPAVAVYRLQSLLGSPDSAFPGWSQLFSLLPGTWGEYLRYAFYRCAIRHCAPDVCISFGTIASHPGLTLGRTTYIGNFCSLGNITVEDDVLIASHVSIMNGCQQHGTARLDIPIREQPGVYEDVTIGEGSWIGERATVAASVGKHCLVGSGALVLKPLPDYAIAVGVPARVIGDRRDRPEQTGVPSHEPVAGTV